MNFFTFSLGCKVNSYECAAISAIFINAGYTINKENPDVVIINTCSITHVADQKSRQHIRKYRKLYPNAIIVVMGCYVQGNKDEVVNQIKADVLLVHQIEIRLLI